MKILVIDGQGGSLGRSLVSALVKEIPSAFIIAVGTNTAATAAMLKAGASVGATGENAVLYNASRCDIIAGPIGILVPNAMYGEVTPAMAAAVGNADAQKVLVPSTQCNVSIVGVTAMPVSEYIQATVQAIMREIQ